MALDAINKGDNYIKEVTKTDSSGQYNDSMAKGSKTNAANGEEKSEETLLGDTEKKLRDAVTGANNKLVQKRTRCEFTYHEDINRVSIKVYDRETDKVLKEIPADETLEMIEKIWDLAGLLVDERR